MITVLFPVYSYTSPLFNRTLRKKEHGMILINLCASLLGVYLFFLTGGFLTSVPVLCGISAALLQYFMLVFFAWTAAEAVHLYFKLVRVLSSQIRRYVLKAALVAWRK